MVAVCNYASGFFINFYKNGIHSIEKEMHNMKKNTLKEKILVAASCAAIALSVIVSGAGIQDMVTPAPIEIAEDVGVNSNVNIGEEDVPLGNSKVTTKTTTKTTKKTKKLKKAAAKTKTTTKVSTKTSSSTKTNASNKVRTDKTVVTTVKTAEKKKSKVQTITTTVKTTIKTTTTTLESGAADIAKVATAAKANSVMQLFQKLGYKVVIDPSVSYTGYFSSVTKSITLKKNDGTTIYHELGHFLGYRAGNVDRMPAFKKIYEEEKSLYTAANKAYVLQNQSEYFAESYRNYVENEAKLKKERPKTYEAIVSAISRMR